MEISMATYDIVCEALSYYISTVKDAIRLEKDENIKKELRKALEKVTSAKMEIDAICTY